MLFLLKVKGEICRYIDFFKGEVLVEILVIMKVSGILVFSGSGLSFKMIIENLVSVRLIFMFLKDYFNIYFKLMVKKSNLLKKNNIYMVVIFEEMGVRDLLSEIGIFKEIDGIMSLDYRIEEYVFKDDNLKRVYVRGVFIGGGSISNFEKIYYLEFVMYSEEYVKDLCNFVNIFKLNFKVI